MKLLLLCMLVLSMITGVTGETLEWSTTPPNGVSVTKTQYRYRTKIFETGSQPTMEGWELDHEEVGAWGDWISNGAAVIEAAIDREVRTIPHAAVSQVTGYQYSRYKYVNSANGNTYLTYGSGYANSMGYWGTWESTTTTAAGRLAPYKVYDGVQAYGNSSGFWFYETPVTSVVTPAYTEYQYRTRTRTYHFYQWSGWSDWQDATVSGSSTTEVETRTLYALDTTKLPSSLNIEAVDQIPMLPDTGCQLWVRSGDPAIQWTSSNTAVAAVDQAGYVSAQDAGTAVITACTAAGTKIAETSVIVKAWPFYTFPADLTQIEREAFANTLIECVDLRNTSVAQIGESAFADCDRLSLVLPGEDLTSIASDAFRGSEKAVLACTKDGYAVQYAQQNGLQYYVIGGKTQAYPVARVKLDPKSAALNIGDTLALKATVEPANASIHTLEWSSNKPEIVSVDQNGQVRALAVGNAVITANACDGSGESDSCVVTVLPISVAKIQLSADAVSLLEGDSTALTATVVPSNATNKELIWTSSDTSVARVDASGKISAGIPGNAVITAYAMDGSGVKATCTVTVKSKVVSGDPRFTRLYVENLTQTNATIRATVYPNPDPSEVGFYFGLSANSLTKIASETNTVTDSTLLIWYDLNKWYQMLSPNVTYYYQFYMMVDGVTCKSDIRSFKTPGNVSITPAVTSFEVGENETYTIQQTVLPSNALVTWISSNPAVATVSNGVVTGVDGGTAVITSTATYGGMSARVQYTVSVNPIEYRAVIVGQYDYPISIWEKLYIELFDDLELLFEGIMGIPYKENPKYKNMYSPINDAEALARALRYRATTLGETPDIHLYTDIGAQEIFDAISTHFGDSDYNDVNIFFFGGHGAKQGLVLCYNYDYIFPQALCSAYQNIKGNNVVIVTTCFAGAFQNFASDRPDSKFYVLAACKRDQTSINLTRWDMINHDREKLVTGFSYYMLSAFGWDSLEKQPMSSMPADQNKDNQITLNELFNYLAPRVADNRNTFNERSGKDGEQNICSSWADGNLVIYERGNNR